MWCVLSAPRGRRTRCVGTRRHFHRLVLQQCNGWRILSSCLVGSTHVRALGFPFSFKEAAACGGDFGRVRLFIVLVAWCDSWAGCRYTAVAVPAWNSLRRPVVRGYPRLGAMSREPVAILPRARFSVPGMPSLHNTRCVSTPTACAGYAPILNRQRMLAGRCTRVLASSYAGAYLHRAQQRSCGTLHFSAIYEYVNCDGGRGCSGHVERNTCSHRRMRVWLV